jgi:NADP-dependent 3-hydroxy acid dehydrogenase YdfG
LSGPLVVITGASSGIGLALARAFAKEGNALLLIARHMKPIDRLRRSARFMRRPTSPTMARSNTPSAMPRRRSARPPA